MVMFTFSVFDRKYLFWADLVQKIKIVNLSWNFVFRLIQICRIQWWRSIFFYFKRETPFLGKFGPKAQNCQFKLKFCTFTNSDMQISMRMFTFSVFKGKHLFRANLVQKIKIVNLTWNLVLRLIQICRIQWECLLSRFSTGNTLFGQIWFKKLKLSI